MPRPPSDKLQRKALAKVSRNPADLGGLLDDIVRLVEFGLEATRNDITRGFAGKQDQFTPDQVRSLSSLTSMVSDLVGAKDRWAKVAKAAGSRLTPAERLEGAVAQILKLDTGPRREAINRLIAEHNARRAHDAQFAIAPVAEAQGTSLPTKPQGSGEVTGPRTALDAIADLA